MVKYLKSIFVQIIELNCFLKKIIVIKLRLSIRLDTPNCRRLTCCYSIFTIKPLVWTRTVYVIFLTRLKICQQAKRNLGLRLRLAGLLNDCSIYCVLHSVEFQAIYLQIFPALPDSAKTALYHVK